MAGQNLNLRPSGYEGAGSGVFALLRSQIRDSARDRSSPWFTAVLVHGWYMEPTTSNPKGPCESPRKPEAARFTVSSGRQSSDLIAPVSALSAQSGTERHRRLPGPRASDPG